MAPAKVAAVLRRRLTQGSRWVITRRLVSTITCIPDALFTSASHASIVLAQSFRRALSLAIDEELASHGFVEGDLPDRRVELEPGGRHGTQILDSRPDGECDILDRIGACKVIHGGRHSNGTHVWKLGCRPGRKVGQVLESHIQW